MLNMEDLTAVKQFEKMSELVYVYKANHRMDSDSVFNDLALHMVSPQPEDMLHTDTAQLGADSGKPCRCCQLLH